jgi:cellulose synthase/poly-beta-1,6-N-acetylglucosamine synthase-like glycosyltransferase
MILIAISLLLLLAYAGVLAYYYRGWKALKEYVPATGSTLKISVIVPARNEEKNLPKLLEALLAQTYSKEFFEVIVVDDFSTDDTSRSVKEFAAHHSQLRIKLIQPQGDGASSSKKKAVAAGVEQAWGEMIVATDADCEPGPRWLETLASFADEKEACFIAGPVRFRYGGRVLEVFQALDFLMLQGITAASVGSGFHDMCNGANLAYRKKSFADVNGFSGIDHVASGDDMLLMYKIRMSNPEHVFYLKNRDAIVETEPMATWKEFIHQRKRWASKSLVYQDWRIKAVLALVYLFNCLFPVIMVFALLEHCYGWMLLLLLMFAGKILAEMFFLIPVAGFYNSRGLLKYFVLFQPLHILYTMSVGFLSQLGKYEWKGRRTR